MRCTDKVSKDAEVVKKIKKILKAHKIRYRFKWKEWRIYCSGYAVFNKGMIVVFGREAYKLITTHKGYDRFMTRPVCTQEFLSTVFHEMGHIFSVRKGQYKWFNRGFDPKTGQRVFNKWASEYLQAERLADRYGKRLMNKHFPRMPFIAAYEGARGRWLAEYAIKSVAEAYNLKLPKGMKR